MARLATAIRLTSLYPVTFSKWDSREKRVARWGDGNLIMLDVDNPVFSRRDYFQFTDLAMISFNCFSFAFLLGKFTAANSFSTAWGGINWLYVEVGDNSLQTRDKSSEGE